MDTSSGRLFKVTSEEDARKLFEDAKAAVKDGRMPDQIPVANDDLPLVSKMNRQQRRAWAREQVKRMGRL